MIRPSCGNDVKNWSGGKENEIAAWLFHRMLKHDK